MRFGCLFVSTNASNNGLMIVMSQSWIVFIVQANNGIRSPIFWPSLMASIAGDWGPGLHGFVGCFGGCFKRFFCLRLVFIEVQWRMLEYKRPVFIHVLESRLLERDKMRQLGSWFRGSKRHLGLKLPAQLACLMSVQQILKLWFWYHTVIRKFDGFLANPGLLLKQPHSIPNGKAAEGNLSQFLLFSSSSIFPRAMFTTFCLFTRNLANIVWWINRTIDSWQINIAARIDRKLFFILIESICQV